MNRLTLCVRSVLGLFATALVLCLTTRASSAPAMDVGFVLEDFTGRTWRNERVVFPLSAPDLQSARAGKALVAPDGTPALYQLVQDPKTKSTQIAFMANLDAFQKGAYRFLDQKNSATSDLKFEESEDTIRLVNSKTGISIRKRLEGGAGPIEGVKLASGKWVGGSRLANDSPVTAYTASVVARGPAFAEIYCRVEWGTNQWHLRFRLDANEPVVLVDESGAVRGKGAQFSLSYSDNFNPDQLFYRTGKQGEFPLNANAISPLKPGANFTFEPWLHWGHATAQGALFSVFRNDGTDLLSFGAREASAWIDPARPGDEQAPIWLTLLQDDKGLHLDLTVKTGRRKWMFTALGKTASLEGTDDPKRSQETTLPSQYFIKHAHFPLDLVKDWTLTWKANDLSANSYPRLLFTRKDLERFRKSVGDTTAFKNAIPTYISDKNQLSQWNMESRLAAWFATGDKKLGAYLATSALRMAQDAVDIFTNQNSTTYGSAPHHHGTIATAALLADAVLSGDVLTPDQRRRLLAQMAFVSYAIQRPEFWSTERGYAGFPNMTTSVYGYRATLACLIPSHPRAKEWIKDTMGQLKFQLDGWSDDNGGWLEAPHYAMVAYDQILACFVMAHNAGLDDNLYGDPKVKKIINWFAKITTPPDSRFGGFRHLPPIGNTYMIEPTSEFGLLAFLFRDKNPAFASQMQWMHLQQKSWPLPGVGGAYPGFAGYRGLMLDAAIPAVAPKYGSELFPQTGLVLRNKYPSDRETYLHVIAGANHSHYDIDSGSITLWGKGRILADDFGYYGMAPAEDHSMLDSTFLGAGATVKEFVPSPDFDYVNTTQIKGGRQIGFVKDEDPLAPNYFVVTDTQRVRSPATWRLWLTAAKVSPTATGALVEGKEDVDMDVFFPVPDAIEIKTEDKTRTAGAGVRPDFSQGAMTTTQTGLIASSQRMGAFSAVLYPRLKTEKAPTFSSLAGGKVVKVESGAGTDYVFQALLPFKFTEGDMQFEGTSGLVKTRGGKTTVVLGADGSLSARGQTTTRGNPHPAAVPVAAYEQATGGDFEGATQTVFMEPVAGSNVALAIAANPVPEDTTAGKKSLAITFDKDGGGVLSSVLKLSFDAEKVYRLSVRLYAPAKMGATMGGYAANKAGAQLKTPEGQVWGWGMGVQGPTKGWQTFQTTLGPAGSGAAATWPADAASINMAFWMQSNKGTIFIDNLSFQEVEPAKP